MKRNLVLLLASCTSTLALNGVAAAAETSAAPASSVTVGEVVVTARGRSELLQKTPAAVTAFSQKALKDARIDDVADFIALTPNVSIVESQEAGNGLINIRGISQVRNGESPVSVVTDGVQQISSRQFTTDLFNVQQIEVLQGPQGALYGRDAVGGAIIITSKQPTDTFHESVDAEVGNGSDYRLEAAVSGPIVPDRLLFRVAGSYHDFGGLLPDTFNGQKVDSSHDRDVQGQLKAFVTSNFTIDFHANYDYTYGGADNFHYEGATNNAACQETSFAGSGTANTVVRSFCDFDVGTDVRTLANASLRFQETTPWATITDTVATAKIGENLLADQLPYTATISKTLGGTCTASCPNFGAFGTQTQWEQDAAVENDFRITSPDTGAFKWMVGAFVLRTTRYISTTTGYNNGEGIVGIYRQPQFSNPINPTLTYLGDGDSDLAYALYGNISYEIIHGLTADFGYRYDNDDRAQNASPFTNAGLGTPGCTTTAPTPGACHVSTDFSKGQPKFTLSYQVDPGLLLFADYGVGFRAGQYNQISPAAAGIGVGQVSTLVKAETADTGEAGFKSTLLNGKLHLDVTGFYTQDYNPFYFVFVGSVGAQVLVNIDQVNLYGGELQADYTPVKGLDLFANFGYTHSSIAKYAYDPADVGNWAPYVPQYTASLGAQYRTPITAELGLFTRGEVEFHGEQYWDPEDDTARSAYALVNLQAGIEKLGGAWSVVAFVKNLSDKPYNVEYVSGGFAEPAEPRTFGVELKGDF